MSEGTLGTRFLKGGGVWAADPTFHNSNNSEETIFFFFQKSEKGKRINVDNHKS